MKRMIGDYLLKQCLGQGAQDKLYRAINTITNSQVAIKCVPAKKVHEIPKYRQLTDNGIKILIQMNKQCPYIVRFVDMLKTVNSYYFVYQYCNGGTLAKLIQRQGRFSEKTTILYLKQILQAFRIVYKKNILHRDLRSQNILFQNGEIRLANFVFCRSSNQKDGLAQIMLGSPVYTSPEVLQGEIYTIKAEIWSLGIVVYQMAFGNCPFQSPNVASLIKLLETNNLNFPHSPKISSTLQQFIRACLVKDPYQRISWQQIFNTYQVTDQGQIINKKQLMTPFLGSGQLRSSVRVNSNTQRLPVNYQNYQPNFRNTVNNNYPVPDISSLNSPKNIINPQGTNPYEQPQNINKSFEPNFDANNALITRKSPIKVASDFSISNGGKQNLNNFGTSKITENNDGSHEGYNSAETSNKSSGIVQKNIKNSCTSQKTSASQQNPSNQEASNFLDGPSSADLQHSLSTARLPNSRIDILLKNHHKTIQINQMLLDVYHQEHDHSDYVCYLIFSSVCRELESLQQKFKQNRSYGANIELKKIIQTQLDNTAIIIKYFLEVFMQMGNQQDQCQHLLDFQSISSNIDLQKTFLKNKYKIIKNYVDCLPDCEEDIRLASQVVDYLLEGILIKRDAYDRMSKEHLLKQMKNKICKQEA